MKYRGFLCTVLLLTCKYTSASWIGKIFGSDENESKNIAPGMIENVPETDLANDPADDPANFPVESKTKGPTRPKRYSMKRPISSSVVPMKHAFDGVLLKHVINNVQKLGSMTELIFVGDTLFFKLSKIRAKWNPLEKKYAAINLGSPWDRSEHILHRYSEGNVLRDITAHGPVVVMMVGGSNAHFGDSPTAIMNGIAATISLLKEHLQNPKILLLSLVPGKKDSCGDVLTAVNAELKVKYEDRRQNGVMFLDITGLFLDDDNSPNRAMYGPDKISPSAAGQVPSYTILDPTSILDLISIFFNI